MSNDIQRMNAVFDGPLSIKRPRNELEAQVMDQEQKKPSGATFIAEIPANSRLFIFRGSIFVISPDEQPMMLKGDRLVPVRFVVEEL